MMRALVTGASRGIGAAVAKRLARDVEVVGVHRRPLPEDAPSIAAWVRVDLTSEGGRAELVAAIESPLDALVLNAGLSIRAPFTTESIEGHDPLVRQLREDLEAPLLLLRALLNARLLASGASIVVTSSNLARRGLTGKVAYAAAKGGLEAAVRGLARELGPRGVRVNAVAPGLVRTDMTANRAEADWAAYAREVPLGREGGADDVAEVVEFFVRHAGYVSGQVLDVDGGWTA